MLGIGYNVCMAEDSVTRLTFGEAVRYRRTQLGLTQRQLADMMKVSQNTLSRWEAMGRPPNDAVILRRLSELLYADPEDLRAGIVRMAPRGGEVHDQLVRIAMEHAETPAEVELLVGIIEGALRMNAEGLRRVEDYVRLLAEHFGGPPERGDAEDDGPAIAR